MQRGGANGWLGSITAAAVMWLSAVACGGELAQQRAEPDAVDEASDEAPGSSSDALRDDTGDDAGDDTAGDVIDAELPDAAATAGKGPFDFEAWCDEREMQVEHLEVERCEQAELGPRPDDTLWCYTRETVEPTGVIFLKTVYVAQRKKLKKLKTVAYAAGTLDIKDADDAENRYVLLRTARDDSGKRFSLVDDQSPSCDEALQRNRDDHPNDKAGLQRVEQLIARVCKARGKYTWRGRKTR